MESNAKCEVVKGLGRNWRWSDLVKADEQQMKLFDELPDPVPCGCYDGSASDDWANYPHQATASEGLPQA